MKSIAKFTSADQTLTITAAQGKSGLFNVKASLKTGHGKGAPKAATGARRTLKTEQEAKEAFDNLVSEARSRGWVAVEKVVRSAFTSIPAPNAGPKPAKQKTA